MASLSPEMGGTYTLGADGMYYPNPERPEEETPRYGKYGRMRHTYLREHKKVYYTTLLFDGKLVAHLNEIDDANERYQGRGFEQLDQETVTFQTGQRQNPGGDGCADVGTHDDAHGLL